MLLLSSLPTTLATTHTQAVADFSTTPTCPRFPTLGPRFLFPANCQGFLGAFPGLPTAHFRPTGGLFNIPLPHFPIIPGFQNTTKQQPKTHPRASQSGFFPSQGHFFSFLSRVWGPISSISFISPHFPNLGPKKPNQNTHFPIWGLPFPIWATNPKHTLGPISFPFFSQGPTGPYGQWGPPFSGFPTPGPTFFWVGAPFSEAPLSPQDFGGFPGPEGSPRALLRNLWGGGPGTLGGLGFGVRGVGVRVFSPTGPDRTFLLGRGGAFSPKFGPKFLFGTPNFFPTPKKDTPGRTTPLFFFPPAPNFLSHKQFPLFFPTLSFFLGPRGPDQPPARTHTFGHPTPPGGAFPQGFFWPFPPTSPRLSFGPGQSIPPGFPFFWPQPLVLGPEFSLPFGLGGPISGIPFCGGRIGPLGVFFPPISFFFPKGLGHFPPNIFHRVGFKLAFGPGSFPIGATGFSPALGPPLVGPAGLSQYIFPSPFWVFTEPP